MARAWLVQRSAVVAGRTTASWFCTLRALQACAAKERQQDEHRAAVRAARCRGKRANSGRSVATPFP